MWFVLERMATYRWISSGKMYFAVPHSWWLIPSLQLWVSKHNGALGISWWASIFSAPVTGHCLKVTTKSHQGFRISHSHPAGVQPYSWCRQLNHRKNKRSDVRKSSLMKLCNLSCFPREGQGSLLPAGLTGTFAATSCPRCPGASPPGSDPDASVFPRRLAPPQGDCPASALLLFPEC